MARIDAPLRGKKSSKRLDASDLRALLQDNRLHAAMGVVTKPPGAESHWKFIEGDLIVEVEQQPDGLDLSCRMATFAGGPGMGLWRIPAVGDEVAILVPSGQIDFQPIIVGILSTGQVPTRVGEGRTVLVAADDLFLAVGGTAVRVRDGNVQLGENASEAVVKGTSYRSAEAAMIVNLAAYIAASAPLAPLIPNPVAAAAFTAAIAAFSAGLDPNLPSPAGFLSSLSKTE